MSEPENTNEAAGGRSDSTAVLGKLPAHDAALFLTHNEHKNYYEDAAKWIEEQGDLFDWQSDGHKRRAIETDSVWVLQWYPNTPVGFNAIAAPTLDELLAFANA
jgi:hypothetical protein